MTPGENPVIPRVFRGEALVEILAFIEAQLAAGATTLAICVLDPDRGRGRYAGERVPHDDAIDHVHRPWRVWVDLAERLGLRLATPRLVARPLVELRFERLSRAAAAAPLAAAADVTEKYGAASAFARVSKLEEPGFVVDFSEAVARAKLPPAPRVLDLGVNTGDELALLRRLLPGATFVGIDHSVSAIAIARARFPDASLHAADLADLAALELGTFDLVVSIGTLQSTGLDDRALVRQVVQRHLAPDGAVIFGFPNCRYVDGEIVYGTRMKNFRQPELGLLVKDVAFYRKYLQQHDRQVFVTGKYYVLVTGVPINSAS